MTSSARAGAGRGGWVVFFPHLLVLPFFIGETGSFQASDFFFWGGLEPKKHGRVVCVFFLGGGWTQNWVKMICFFLELHNHFISAIMKEF